MLNICSLFQKFFGIIKSISKKVYRNCFVILSGALLFAIVALTANGFTGAGKNKTNNYIDKDDELSELDSDDETKDMILQGVLLDLDCSTLDSYELRGNIINTKAYNLVSNSRCSLNSGNIRASIVPNTSREMLGIAEETSNYVEENSLQANNTDAQIITENENQIQEINNMPSENVEPQESTTPIQPETQEVITETVPQATEELACNQNIQTGIGFDISEDDYYWLSQIVEAEAGNQDEIGRILVANVIFNRVRSEKFPETVKKIIFQNNGRTYQFEPVKNNRIYDVVPSEKTIECVNRAINGEDYSEGALFFTMRTSNSSWFNRCLNLLFIHGDHYFYTYY